MFKIYLLTYSDPLAYMIAKSHGLSEECDTILEACGLTEEQINLPTIGSQLTPPKPVVQTFKSNWPTKATSQSVFEKALLGQVEGLSIADESTANSHPFGHEDGEGDGSKDGAEAAVDDDEDAAGWDMGDDFVPEVESDFVNVDSAEAGAGSSEADHWARNSPLAADHVASGSFETAMQLLNRQLGAVCFEPLKARFLEVYQSSRTYLPASAGLPPLVNYVRRTIDETDPRKVLPIIPRDIEYIAANELQRGYDAMKGNKLEDGALIFRNILHALLVNVVASKSEVAEAKKLIVSAAEYSVAMSIELARRKLGPNDLKRSLELSAYFTIPKLEVIHRQFALANAMKVAYTNKNFNTALSFANRILANGENQKILENVSHSDVHSCTQRLIMSRRGGSRLNANAIQMTPTRLILTSLQSLMSALHHSLRSTAAALLKAAPTTDPNIRQSTRGPCASFAAFARLASREVGCDLCDE